MMEVSWVAGPNLIMSEFWTIVCIHRWSFPERAEFRGRNRQAGDSVQRALIQEMIFAYLD
jgi:hypothetical protein